MEISKKDWKLFREKIKSWQASYMATLVQEYTELLRGDAPASSKFWALEERIKKDKKKPGVLLRLDKKEMVFAIIRLIDDGAITMDDLEDFSDALKDRINLLLESNF